MKKLDLIIVGAQKAGTTSLNNYLKSHPKVSGHSTVEFSFFSDPSEYKKGYNQAIKNHFEDTNGDYFIAKNVTISLQEESMPRLREHNSDIKIVFLMREPVSRAYSAYNMAVKDGWMTRSFSELREIIHKKKYDDIMFRHFIKHGMYAQQINTILKYFSVEQVQLLFFEDLKRDPQKVCNLLFNWLDLPEYEIEHSIHNPTYQPRSKLYGSLLHKLRDENNPIKRLVKTIIPYSVFSFLGSKLLASNRSNNTFQAISEEDQKLLLSFYKPYNLELSQLLDKWGNEDSPFQSSQEWLKRM